MQDNTAEFRSMLDGIAQQVVDRAQEMIRQGMRINAAFKMAIAWELEVQMKAVMTTTSADRVFMRTTLTALSTAIRMRDDTQLYQICTAIESYIKP